MPASSGEEEPVPAKAVLVLNGNGCVLGKRAASAAGVVAWQLASASAAISIAGRLLPSKKKESASLASRKANISLSDAKLKLPGELTWRKKGNEDFKEERSNMLDVKTERKDYERRKRKPEDEN